MALYKDGNPVSGLNSIPRLTLAQYNALNVKPEIWIRTDAPESYKKLSADQVSYDSNNTVKDKIDNVEAKIKTFSYAEKSPDSATSLTAGQSKTITFDITKTGYTPFCVASWSTGNIDVTVANIQVINNTIRFDVKNNGTSTVNITPVARLQYISS